MRTTILYVLSILVAAVPAFFVGRLVERKGSADKVTQIEEPKQRPKLSGLPDRPVKKEIPEEEVEEPEVAEEEPLVMADLIAGAAQKFSAASLSQAGMFEAQQMIAQIAPENLAAALEEIGKLPHGKVRQSLTATVIARVAETDGSAAMVIALEKVAHANRPAALAGALSAWSEKDPAGALKWYSNNFDDPEFELVLGAKPLYLLPTIFQGLVASDISAAFSAFSKLGTVEEKHQALDGMATASLSAADTVRALDLAKVLGGDARSARLRLVNSWGVREPATAAAWISDSVTDPTEKAEFAAAVARSWIAYDPQTAVPWLLNNTGESRRPETIELATGIWVRSDPTATAEWLGSLPAGSDLDRGKSTYARNVIDLNPATALNWAKTIDNDNMRMQTVVSVVSQWRVREPTEDPDKHPAVVALRESGLPQEEIDNYLLRAGVRPAPSE